MRSVFAMTQISGGGSSTKPASSALVGCPSTAVSEDPAVLGDHVSSGLVGWPCRGDIVRPEERHPDADTDHFPADCAQRRVLLSVVTVGIVCITVRAGRVVLDRDSADGMSMSGNTRS